MAFLTQNNNEDFNSVSQDETIERGFAELRQIVGTFRRLAKSATREKESLFGAPQKGIE